jgi:hypothetical protein
MPTVYSAERERYSAPIDSFPLLSPSSASGVHGPAKHFVNPAVDSCNDSHPGTEIVTCNTPETVAIFLSQIAIPKTS